MILGIAVIGISYAAPTLAGPTKISSPEAIEAQANGKLIIVDVRTPYEWRESGVAEGAFLLDMRDRDFVRKLAARMGEQPGVPVALICATGARSNHVATQLEKHGMTGIIDISEGMYGSDVGPGWLARRLPIQQYKEPSVLDRFLK